MVDKSYNLIDEHYGETKNDLENNVSNNFKVFQKQYEKDNKDLKRQLNKECELTIINEM